METVKSFFFSWCINPDADPFLPFFFCSAKRAVAAFFMGSMGYFALSSLSLAHGGNHMSGQNNQGPPSHHEGRYLDPFWGSGWYPGYTGDYDSNYSYAPTPTQATTAQKQVKTYLMAVGKAKRHAATHRYIAVETLRPTKTQLEDYAKKQSNAKSATAAGGEQMSNRWVAPSQLRCMMVFDTKSKQFVGSGCYVIGNLPPVGTVAKFDTFSAEYVGTQAL